jgi:hypothetical protein
VALVVAALCFSSATAIAVAPVGAAPPPDNRTYFAVFFGLEGAYSTGADCLSFTATELCTSSSGLCGSWTRTEPVGRETGIAFEFSFEEDGIPVTIDGRARINDRGKRDSLAAVARVRIAGESVNFGFTGRSTGPAKCLRLWGEWSRQNPPEQGEQDSDCLARASFGDPAEPAYVLPYPAGKEYRVSQTYCFAEAGHRTQLAYDFATPIGSEVIAARAGVVRRTRQDLPDDGRGQGPGDHNHVYIEHDDGTVAFYAHLRQNGVRVQVGDRIESGQLIALNGNSGDTGGPHLHFGVYRTWPVQEGNDVPVSFRNALGPLDERGGLLRGVFYTALAQ